MDILAAGLIVSDIIVHPVDISLFSADSVAVEEIKFAAGGDSMNVAVNLATLGVNAGLAGMIGSDVAGDFIMGELKKRGINSDGIVRSEQYGTSTSVALTEHNGERHFAYYGKSNNNFRADMVTDEVLRSVKLLFIGSVMALDGISGDGLCDLFKRAKSHGVTTAMDATYDKDNQWMKRIETALPFTDIFIPSIAEAEKIIGAVSFDEMKRVMSGYGLKVFGVKYGKDGCKITDFENDYNIPAFKCDNIADTIGAGDAFMAGFLYGELNGWNSYKSAVFGCATANFCIRSVGAATNPPSYQQAVNFIKSEINAGRYSSAADLY